MQLDECQERNGFQVTATCLQEDFQHYKQGHPLQFEATNKCTRQQKHLSQSC